MRAAKHWRQTNFAKDDFQDCERRAILAEDNGKSAHTNQATAVDKKGNVTSVIRSRVTAEYHEGAIVQGCARSR